MEMGIRIGTLIKELEISKAKFAETVGTSASRVSNITTGRNKPDALMLERIILNFADVNPGWLLTGKGEMFLSAQAKAAVNMPMGDASTGQIAESQDIVLLTQRADYLERENELLRGFIADLRRVLYKAEA